MATNNSVHDEAQAEIMSRVVKLKRVKVIGFGASALTSFPMRINVPSTHTWHRLQQALEHVGLKAEPHTGTAHPEDGSITIQVEVHVPANWQRPAVASAPR